MVQALPPTQTPGSNCQQQDLGEEVPDVGRDAAEALADEAGREAVPKHKDLGDSDPDEVAIQANLVTANPQRHDHPKLLAYACGSKIPC